MCRCPHWPPPLLPACRVVNHEEVIFPQRVVRFSTHVFCVFDSAVDKNFTFVRKFIIVIFPCKFVFLCVFTCTCARARVCIYYIAYSVLLV